MSTPFKIYLYSDYPSSALDIARVSEYLSGFGFECDDRGNLLDFLCLSDELLDLTAERLSGAIVEDISSDLSSLKTAAALIDSEIRRLKGRQDLRGTLYDGYWVQRILHNMMAESGLELAIEDALHIVFTGRLFGTFEDRRYHARVVLTGQPSLISTSGIVEAPAKPREYYFIKGGLIQSGRDTSVLDEMYKGKFLEYDDPKTTRVICSYALQAAFYHAAGQAFCENTDCCLYNSHWQEDVLRVQYEGKPCNECLELLKM